MNSSAQTSQASTKTRQIAHLAQQLQLLAQRTEQLEQLSATTAEQASYMRLLGGYHAAWCVLCSCTLLLRQPGSSSLEAC